MDQAKLLFFENKYRLLDDESLLEISEGRNGLICEAQHALNALLLSRGLTATASMRESTAEQKKTADYLSDQEQAKQLWNSTFRKICSASFALIFFSAVTDLLKLVLLGALVEASLLVLFTWFGIQVGRLTALRICENDQTTMRQKKNRLWLMLPAAPIIGAILLLIVQSLY